MWWSMTSQPSFTSNTLSIGRKRQPVETPWTSTGTTECTCQHSLHWTQLHISSPICSVVQLNLTSISTRAAVGASLPFTPLSCLLPLMTVTRSSTAMARKLADMDAPNSTSWRQTSMPSEVLPTSVIKMRETFLTATAMDSVILMCFLTSPLDSLPQDQPQASTLTRSSTWSKNSTKVLGPSPDIQRRFRKKTAKSSWQTLIVKIISETCLKTWPKWLSLWATGAPMILTGWNMGHARATALRLTPGLH